MANEVNQGQQSGGQQREESPSGQQQRLSVALPAKAKKTKVRTKESA